MTAFMAHRFGLAVALDAHHAPPRLRPRRGAALGGRAEALPFAADSLDLVVSLQALHHFEIETHLREAARCLRPGGVFAALSWGALELPSAVALAYEPVFRALEPHWERARSRVKEGYAGLAFRGRRVRLPAARLSRRLSFDQLDGTIARWSATQRALEVGAEIPDPDVTARQRRRGLEIDVSWPLLGQVFRVQ